jgi:hypothetical protein
MATALALTDATFHSPRHTTHSWEAGPAGGPLMISSTAGPRLVWCGSRRSRSSRPRAGTASRRTCVAMAVHLRPSASEAYALKEIVDDMVELEKGLTDGTIPLLKHNGLA